MTTMHVKIVTLLMLSLSVGLLAQTQGCDLGPLTNLLASLSSSQPGSGSQDDSPGDDNGNDGMDDNQSDDNGGDDGNGGPADVELVANLSGAPTMSGHARYRVIAARIRLDIEVEDALPNTVLAISVTGMAAGDLTIGSLGEGEVEFDTQSELESGHTPWPAGVDTNLVVGALIQVGTLSGTLTVGP